MSSAICFNLDQSRILSSCNDLSPSLSEHSSFTSYRGKKKVSSCGMETELCRALGSLLGGSIWINWVCIFYWMFPSVNFSEFQPLDCRITIKKRHFNLEKLRLKVNPFPHYDTFRHPWETSLLKTLWEKEKLLVTSNFSFSNSVFNPSG